MICISFLANEFKMSKNFLQKVDFAELRLDATLISPSQIKEIISPGKKIIVTCRPGFKPDEERKSLLISAIEAGADYVDIEIESKAAYREELIGVARKNCCNIIISYHNYQDTPKTEELEKIITDGFAFKADIVKIACMVNQMKDNTRLLSLYDYSSSCDGWILAIGMGDLGKITRVAAPFLGAPFTLASHIREQKTARGQLDSEQMQVILNILRKKDKHE